MLYSQVFKLENIFYTEFMKNLWRQIRAKQYDYQPLVKVNVYREHLLHNYLFFKNKSELAVAPVLKSNAYGHGLVPLAQIMERERPPFMVVDSYFEAMILRNEGIKASILVIGYTKLANIRHNGLSGVAFTVTDMDWLRQLAKITKRPVKIHLKIDTGMNRQGIEMGEVAEGIRIIKNNKHLVLEGICSHLADGDNCDVGFTKKQIKRWNNIVRQVGGELPELKFWHLGASSSLFFKDKIYANVMRLGLSLYGIQADAKMSNSLKPALQVETCITSVRRVKQGERIGYSCTYTAPRDMTVATIPFGYNEGMDRRLSNQGWVKVNGEYCPIVGRVSMNITSIDVSGIVGVNHGRTMSFLEVPVEVISSVADDKNSIEAMAKLCGTIPYEIMVHLPEKLRRVVV